MKRNNFLSGTLILVVGGFLAKIFSAIYRIGLTRILGGEGIGIYQLIFPAFSLCVVLASSGIPLAVSRLISKYKDYGQYILKKCVVLSSIISLVLGLSLLLLGKGILLLSGVQNLSICYVILAPTLIIISLTSVIKGYFQGINNFTPTAVSNILEQAVKMIFGLSATFYFIKFSVASAVISAILAVAISEIISFITMILFLKNNSKENNENIFVGYKEIANEIFSIILPYVIMPLSTFLDSILVVKLLSINYSTQISLFMYGLESGAVTTLISLPTLISFALASVIMPNFSQSATYYNNQEKLTLSIKIILTITIPMMSIFVLFPNRVIGFVYSNSLDAYGISGSNLASRLLAISSFGTVFISLNQIYTTVLQSAGKKSEVIRNAIIAVVSKLLLELLFLPSATINIFAFALAGVVCSSVNLCLNYFEGREIFKLYVDANFFSKLIICTLNMILILIAIFSVKFSWGNTFLAFVVGGIVFMCSSIFFKLFNKKDIKSLKSD